jgi:hypothetical protein
MSGAGKAAWRYTAPTALFFCGRFTSGGGVLDRAA